MIQHWVVSFHSVMSPVRDGVSTFIGTKREAKGHLLALILGHTWREDGDTFSVSSSNEHGEFITHSVTYHPSLGWMWS